MSSRLWLGFALLCVGCSSSPANSSIPPSSPPSPPPPPPPSADPVYKVTLSTASEALTVGGTVTITATLKGTTGLTLAGRVITWESSNPSAVGVDNGVVTGLAKGDAIIVATSEGKTAGAVITVR